MMMKRCLLQKVFGWTERYSKWGITSSKAWAKYAWADEHESSIWGTGKVRSSPCYVAQEVERILTASRNGTK